MLIKVNCAFCNKEFKREKFQIDSNNKRGRKNFCSQKCVCESRRDKIETSCEECGTKFKSKKSEKRKYCSRSCSATSNNRKKERKISIKYCGICQTECTGKICKKCSVKTRREASLNKTLREVLYEKGSPASKRTFVCTQARAVAKDLGWDTCIKCGYNKHVEIAHIKPVASFDLDTKLSVINSPSNLMALCPNCHWEYDHPKVADTGVDPVRPSL